MSLDSLRPLDLFNMLDESIGWLPEDRLGDLAKGRIPLARIADEYLPEAGLLEIARAFQKRSLDGIYYETFEVGGRNCMEISRGTLAWMAEYRSLLDRCVAEERRGDPGEVREACEVLAGMVARIDAGEEILFFADEGGSWQFGED